MCLVPGLLQLDCSPESPGGHFASAGGEGQESQFDGETGKLAEEGDGLH